MERSTRLADPPTKPAPAPAAAVKPDPEVWQLALREAGGDARRLEVVQGGRAVVVHNQPRR